jgi:hypothetical protein
LQAHDALARQGCLLFDPREAACVNGTPSAASGGLASSERHVAT